MRHPVQRFASFFDIYLHPLRDLRASMRLVVTLFQSILHLRSQRGFGYHPFGAVACSLFCRLKRTHKTYLCKRSCQTNLSSYRAHECLETRDGTEVRDDERTFWHHGRGHRVRRARPTLVACAGWVVRTVTAPARFCSSALLASAPPPSDSIPVAL
jgi:hypothetical protein